MQPVEHFEITYEKAKKAGALPLIQEGIKRVILKRQKEHNKLMIEQQKQQKKVIGD